MLKRFLKVGQSNINSVIDQLEDPIKMTEQGIRDLKKDLQAAMESLAQVKAMAMRTRREANAKQKLAEDYENKAKKLLLNASKGAMDTAEAERLATLALEKQAELTSEAKRLSDEATGHETMSATINTSVSKLRSTLTTYDNELITLKARAKTAASTKKINAQLSTIDSSGTVAMLERMKERVEEEESLASAYGEILDQTDTTDNEIDKALADKTPKGSAMLEDLKKRMDIEK
ncbi:phage shock protein A (PspA) family protein [Desulfocicer vacuolatum DSM 3385]|uniref:Phage shock protein A (PspA) family protein n=1 Tax=Desulfocicer vacuolatum DSM 3385 TaxID=1121400 RepID=A0A1W2D405_9BACT|nr:PspA/IM30 family protein [Desulfocicer vacuolatum]SMC92149.1 phage shock protein A (PspA) family protein [Desulfocicer vacuolatum DSM 3385]